MAHLLLCFIMTENRSECPAKVATPEMIQDRLLNDRGIKIRNIVEASSIYIH